MTDVQVSFVREMAPSVDCSGQTADLEFTTKPLSSSGQLLIPMQERYLAIPVRMLQPVGTNLVRLRGSVPWPSYRLLFGRPHPHSHKVKTEYHRRSRSRGRKR